MRPSELCSILNISSEVLYRRSGTNRGTFLIWVCREILVRASDRLSGDERNTLIETMRTCVSDGAVMGNVLNNLFINKLLVFDSPVLNRLVKTYSYGNIHNVVI